MQKEINVFSLFSGCGGLDLGFKQAGFNINAAIDNWADALITHSKNFPNTEIIELMSV